MKRAFSGQNLFLLFALSLGHMLTHCFQQGWYIVMPAVKGTFGLSDIQFGVIESMRSAANAAVLMPAGFAADILHKQWVIATTGGLAGFGVAYVVLALAPHYGIVLLASMILGAGMALWHPAALSVLSYRLASRRGFALSIHGMGGNIGNAVGPAMVGILIGTVAWQTASWMLAIPLILLALLMWVALRKIPGVVEGNPTSARQYLSSLIDLLRNRALLILVICNSLRAMGTVCVFTFFALYCSEDLGFSPAKVGFYYMLMMASGIASQPILGHLSDRFGRSAVLIPSLLLLGLLQILIVWAGSGCGAGVGGDMRGALHLFGVHRDTGRGHGCDPCRHRGRNHRVAHGKCITVPDSVADHRRLAVGKLRHAIGISLQRFSGAGFGAAPAVPAQGRPQEPG